MHKPLNYNNFGKTSTWCVTSFISNTVEVIFILLHAWHESPKVWSKLSLYKSGVALYDDLPGQHNICDHLSETRIVCTSMYIEKKHEI